MEHRSTRRRDPATGSESSYSKDDAERTFAVNRTVESTTIAPGQVTRLNVAVLVDEAMVTEEQRATIESMIGTAAGVDLARGDQVIVTRLPFDTRPLTSAAVAAEQEASRRRGRRADVDDPDRCHRLPHPDRHAPRLSQHAAGPPRGRHADRHRRDPGRADQRPGPDRHRRRGVRRSPRPTRRHTRHSTSSSALADRQPEEVAQILQSWLADEAVPK